MTERVVQFGAEKRLTGVTAGVQGESDAVLLLFNAGIVHRVGAHRLNVKLARAVAKAGMPSLRFDLAGLGDSAPAAPGLGFAEQASADISAAVDCAATTFGATRFIALGMCSGADNSYRAALADPRIEGLVLLDPYAYAHRGAAVDALLAKAADPARWRRRLSGIFKASPVDEAPASAPVEEDDQSRPIPPREEFGRDLAELCERGVRIYILYTRFVSGFVTKPQHFFDTFSSFDFKGRLRVDVIGDADHTYTPLSQQQVLQERVVDWLTCSFVRAEADG